MKDNIPSHRFRSLYSSCLLCDVTMTGFDTRTLFLFGFLIGAVTSIPLLAQFAVDQALALGIGLLTDDLTDNDYQSQLEDIIQHLEMVNEKLDQGLHLTRELKEQGTVNLATEIELELNVFISRYRKLVVSHQHLNQSNEYGNNTEALSLLKEDVEKFKMDTAKIPELLKKLHDLIVGSSTVSAGRSAGLACDFVSHVFRELESEEPYSGKNNFNKVLETIHGYRDTLMTLQVVPFQLRNASCSFKNVLCKAEALELENHLQKQYGRFDLCIPGLVKNFADSLSDVTIVQSGTKQVLYNRQYASLVVDGSIDWDRITSPQPQGLICPSGNSTTTWSFVDAKSSPGQNEFYLRAGSGCLLGFDQKFVHYKQDVPTVWTSGDVIDRKEYLMCSKSDSAYKDAGLFRILPIGHAPGTLYQLKEIKTGKYLNVRVKKTSVLEEIHKRLVVTLLLNTLKTNPWNITATGQSVAQCKERTLHSQDSSDYTWIIVICVVGFIILSILLPLGIWCYKKRKDY